MPTFLHDSNLFPNVVNGAAHNRPTILVIPSQKFDFIARITSLNSFDRLRSNIETKAGKKNEKQTNLCPPVSFSQI